MASTYTLNNGIELIGTGEQSGTWGDTTNTNFELIDTALDGQISLTLSSAGSSGSPNALPVSDGASSNGRNRLISYVDGGDLGATVYVQLTPNDAEKIIYIKNVLSGSRSIIVFQGTYNASNDYEIPAGKTAVVYFNGGGTGAVAANVFNNAHFDALNVVGDATIAGTLNVGTVEFDSLSGTGSVTITDILDEDNMASNSPTKLSTQQSIKAYVDSQVATSDTLTEVLANGNTTATDQKIQFRDSAIYINSSVDGQLDIVADTEIQLTAPTVDLTGNATFADNGKAIFGASSDLQIYNNGTDSFIDETSAGWLYIRGNNAVIGKYTGETYFKGIADGAVELYHNNVKKIETTASGIAVAGNATFADNGKAIFGAGSDLQIYHDGNNSVIDEVGAGNLFVRATNINFQNRDSDPDENYIVCSANGSVTLSYDGSAKFATSGQGINVSSTGDTIVKVTSADGSTAVLDLGDASDPDGGRIFYDAGSNLGLCTASTERMRIDSSGKVGIGTSSPSGKTHSVAANNQVAVMAGGDVSDPLYPAFGFDGQIGSNGGRGAGMYLPADSTLAFSSAGSEAMRIDSSQNVSIPSGNLDVTGNVTVSGTVDGRDIATNIPASLGTAGQVLTVNSGASAGEWADAAGGGAVGGGSDEIFFENGQTVTTNYTITNGKNAMSAGPITINSGVTVTVGAGETWTVI